MSRDREQGHPTEALSAFLDGEIGEREASDLAAHLAACASCRDLLADLRRVEREAKGEPRPPVPADLVARIRERVEAEIDRALHADRPSRAPSRGSAQRPASAPGRPPEHAAGSPPARRPARWRWWSPLPLAAAAGICVVAMVGYIVISERRPAPRPPAPPPSAPEEAGPSPSPPEKTMAQSSEMKSEALTAAPPVASRPEASPPPAAHAPARQAPPGRSAPAATPPSVVPPPAPPSSTSRTPATAPPATQKTGVARSDGARVAAGAAESAPTAGSSGGRPAETRQEALAPTFSGRTSEWPVRVEAGPYLVVLASQDTMTIRTGAWICTIPIEPADGDALARQIRQEEAARSSGTSQAAPAPSTSARGARVPEPSVVPAAAPVSAADAARALVRDRYRTLIESRCGRLPE